jgi:hypothetical protein
MSTVTIRDCLQFLSSFDRGFCTQFGLMIVRGHHHRNERRQIYRDEIGKQIRKTASISARNQIGIAYKHVIKGRWGRLTDEIKWNYESDRKN